MAFLRRFYRDHEGRVALLAHIDRGGAGLPNEIHVGLPTGRAAWYSGSNTQSVSIVSFIDRRCLKRHRVYERHNCQRFEKVEAVGAVRNRPLGTQAAPRGQDTESNRVCPIIRPGAQEAGRQPCRRGSTQGGGREGDSGDGPGCGNGRHEAGGAARGSGSDKRRRRSGSCVGIRSD